MSTSNSYDYNESRNDIILDALTRLGVIREGGTPPAATYTRCSAILNKMVKQWQKMGINVWTENEGTVFLIPGQSKYSIVGSGNIAGDDVVGTELSASGSGTSLTVTSTTGISALDKIGIELDDDTRQWTTIVSVDSSTTLTINTALTGTASSGNTVYTYTTESTKPVNVSSCRFRDSDGIDTPVQMVGRDEFMALTDKVTTGDRVTQAFYDAGRSSGIFYIWPVPKDCTGRLNLSYSRQIQDFDTSSDNPDFPVEWLEPITLNLMVKIAPIYGKKDSDMQGIRSDAERALVDMRLNDMNNGSIQVCGQDRDMY